MKPHESSAHVQQPGDAALAARLKEIRVFDKRWDLLKEVLEPLFRKETVGNISNAMERRLSFRASEDQYKYRFRVWGWTGKKNSAQVPKHIKQEIMSRAQKRAARGKVTAAEFKGQIIHPQRLRSEIDALSNNNNTLTISQIFRSPVGPVQHFGSYVPFNDSLLLIWNMPFGARPSITTPPWMHPSPFVPGETPDGLIITTPANTAPTPSDTEIVSTYKPSLMPAVQLQRTRLVAQGKFGDLLRTMNLIEQKTLSIWLYQYWFYSFVTAQEWGRGPLHWTADLLNFADYGAVRPASLTNTPYHDAPSSTPRVRHTIPGPPSTCYWSIHVDEDDIVEEPWAAESEHDVSGNHWPRARVDDSVEERLLGGLRNNSFSDVAEDQLPVSISKVVKAAQRPPSDLLLESLAFAIMGRNVALVISCLKKAKTLVVDIGAIKPLHIATSYLDGGSSCCMIIDELCAFLRFQGRYKSCITNEHGHTILDNLFLSVLRSHSDAPLSIVDGSLGERARYAGTEVDICGRWSADSHCYRTLIASGERNIPSTWKHKFCHTSIQAVWHTLAILLDTLPILPTEQSGLFKHTCPNPSCGLRMQLGPLHALVVVAMFLATYGCSGEDLLGTIACYLCMIRAYVDPLQVACLSVPQILGLQTADICIHADMTPSDFAMQLREAMSSFPFTNAVTVGWDCLIKIMRMAESAKRAQTDAPTSSDSESIDSNSDSANAEAARLVNAEEAAMDRDQGESHNDFREQYPLCGIGFDGICDECGYREANGLPWYFSQSNGLGHAWAVIQAELSNYRPLTEGDSWSSPYFSLEGLLESLSNNGSMNLAYIKNRMLKPYCSCGQYLVSYVLPTRQEMFKEYCANMDGSHEAWKKTSFLGKPALDDNTSYAQAYGVRS
ncbi:hypothetical protein PMZ80_004164 [Knufia obscura]|uniref:Clr5 domain-containing protein n=1 Tax=Knufia obscura TaxID=1635080 RepID=A0ABR0RSD2_9EURO|nr:hypothetical protein PMZ80_004164 [Knufia obscura]